MNLLFRISFILDHGRIESHADLCYGSSRDIFSWKIFENFFKIKFSRLFKEKIVWRNFQSYFERSSTISISIIFRRCPENFIKKRLYCDFKKILQTFWRFQKIFEIFLRIVLKKTVSSERILWRFQVDSYVRSNEIRVLGSVKKSS